MSQMDGPNALLESQAQGTSLFQRCDKSEGLSKGWFEGGSGPVARGWEEAD